MKKQIRYFIILLLPLLFSCNIEPRGNDDPYDINEKFKFKIIDFEPSWSPTEDWIAYTHDDSLYENNGIYLIHPDGSGKFLWHQYGVSPSWSPDGKWITFSQNAQIWKKKLDGDSLTQLTFEGRNFFPSWSQDGEYIAFDGWIPDEMNVYGIFKTNITGNDKVLIGYTIDEGAIRMPNWSNNSAVIHIRYSKQFYSSEVFLMDSKGKNENRLTFNNSTDYFPRISINNRIIFTSASSTDGIYAIWIMDENGNYLQKLIDQGYSGNWSPDDKKIVYTDSRLENGRLWIMNIENQEKHQLTFEQ